MNGIASNRARARGAEQSMRHENGSVPNAQKRSDNAGNGSGSGNGNANSRKRGLGVSIIATTTPLVAIGIAIANSTTTAISCIVTPLLSIGHTAIFMAHRLLSTPSDEMIARCLAGVCQYCGSREHQRKGCKEPKSMVPSFAGRGQGGNN